MLRTNFPRLLDVESVGSKSNVWVHESHDISHVNLQLVSWVEEQFKPSKNINKLESYQFERSEQNDQLV